MNICISFVIFVYLVAAILIRDINGASTPPKNNYDDETNKQQAVTGQENSSALQQQETPGSPQKSSPPVPQLVLEAIDNAVRQALERRLSETKGSDGVTPHRMDEFPARALPEEPKLLVDQTVFETVTQAIEEALSLISTTSAESRSLLDQTMVKNIDQAIKDSLSRRISVMPTKLHPAVPEIPAISFGSFNPVPILDEPIIRAIDRIVKNSLRQIFSTSKFKQTENIPTSVDDAIITDAVDQAVRDSLTLQLPKPEVDKQKSVPTSPSRELEDAPLPKLFLEAINKEVKSVLMRGLHKVGLHPTNERSNVSVGDYPANERPTTPVRDYATIKSSPAPLISFGSLDETHLKAIDKVKIGSSVPQQVNPIVYPPSNSKQKNNNMPPTQNWSLEPSTENRQNIAGESKSFLKALTEGRKPADLIMQQEGVKKESAEKSPEKSSHYLPEEEENESDSDYSSAKEDEVIDDRRTLLLRPIESDTKHDETDIEITSSTFPVKVERFPSDAVLMTFKTEEEAELFKEAIANSKKIEVRDGESFPHQVWILDVGKGVNEEDLYSSIKETYKGSPKKIRFSKHSDNGDLRVAHIEVRRSLFEKIKASPIVQIGGNTHEIDTSLEVERCSRCWLLGHSWTKCKNPPQPSLSAVSEGNVCYDCQNYNTVLRKQIGVKKAANQYRKVDHPTDSKTCPTKVSLNKQSRKLKQKIPYL